MNNSYAALGRVARAGRPAPLSIVARLLPGLLLALLLALPGRSLAQGPGWGDATTGTLTQANGTSQTRAVATDASGNVFVTGNFTGQVAFGSTVLSSRGGNDVFVAKYVPVTATWAWAQCGGGTGSDQGQGIAVSGSSVYVTGFITNDTNNTTGVLFGGTGGTSGTVQVNGAGYSSNPDVLLAKYTDNGSTASLGWTQVGGGGLTDQGMGVAVSGTSVYVTGFIQTDTNNGYLVLFGGTGTTAGTVPQNGATGTISQDLLLAKYTDNGPTASLGWTQVGGGYAADQGLGVAVNGSSVYVTGYIQNDRANTQAVLFGGTGATVGTVRQNGATTTNSQDLLLAKYTDNVTSAALNWTQVGGGTSSDQGLGVAAITVGGIDNVYVTGFIQNNTGNTQGVLFGGTGTTTGTTRQNGATASTSQDLLLAKYTDGGNSANLRWTQVGGGTGVDQGSAVTAVSAGSISGVYVAGVLQNNTLNAAGVLFGGTGPTTGTLRQNGASTTNSQDLLLANYTDNGGTATLGWTQVGGGTSTDLGYGVALSGSDVYAGGYVSSAIAAAFGTATGSPVTGTSGARGVLAGADAATGSWQVVVPTFNGGSSQTRAVATDASGNVFVTGYFSGQVVFGSTVLSTRGGQDLFVAKYVPATATWAWAQCGGGTGTDQGLGIAVSGGSVYVTGYIQSNTANVNQVLFGGTGGTSGTLPQYGATASTGSDLLVAKYTDNGSSAALGWTQVGGGTGTDQGQGVAVNGTSVYVTGYIQNNNTNTNLVLFGGSGITAGTMPQYGASGSNTQDILLAKYTDNGPTATLGWTQVGGGISSDQGQGVAAITVGGITSVYVTGTIINDTGNTYGVLFGGTGTTAGTMPQYGATGTISQDVLLAKYTDNGTTASLGWTQVGGGTSTDLGNGVAVNGTSVYVTGTIINDTGNTYGVLFGGTGPTVGTMPQYGATASSSPDLLLAKYTDNGPTATLGWTQVGGGTSTDLGNGVAVNGTSVYVTGYLSNTTGNASNVLFGGSGTTAGTTPQAGASGTASPDVLLARYNDNGATATLGWTQVGGGTGTDQGYGVAVSGTSVYAGGYVTPSASFGNFTIANPAGSQTTVLTRAVDEPSITSFTPTSGPVGQLVTITGIFFSNASSVSFGGVPAAFTVVNSTTITATVPAGAVTGPIGVVVPTANLVSATNFTVLPTTLSCPTANNALNFDGTDDIVRSNARLPALPALTLEAWVYQEANSGFRVLLNGDNFPAGAVHCHMTNGAMQFTVNGSSPADYYASTGVALNTWAHVAVVYTSTGGAGGSVKFYLNGAPLNTITATSTVPIVSQNYSLGAWFSGSAQRFFDGSLNEVRVWSVARTDAQILASYQAQLPAQAGLIARYSFDQGIANGTNTAQTTLADDSGSGRSGTLAGFALTPGTQSNYVAGNSLNQPFTISSFAPTSGVVGQVITLTGTGFTGATGVSFNGTAAPAFTVVSSTTITATVPAGAGSGTLRVTTACGTVANASVFTVCAPPLAIAQNVAVTLDASGNATLAATAVNNGSTANCGVAAPGTLSLQKFTTSTISGEVNEGGTLTLTAPNGGIFLAVNFASYGTPTGTAGSYAVGTCHAANSMAIVSTALLGNNSGSIAANNSPSFGDPCNGTAKKLAVTATYGYYLASAPAVATAAYTCAEVGTQYVVLTVTDVGGNRSTAQAVVTVSPPALPTTIWTGASSSSWADCANWTSGKLPDAATNAVVPAGLPLYPTVGVSSGTLAVKDVTIDAGASLTVASGATLQVSGNFANSGAATLSGTVAFVGSAATQTLSNGGGFGTVTVNKSAGTVQLAQPLVINTALTLTSGTLTTGSYPVTLTGTATLTESNTSYIIGTVVANRTLAAGTAEPFGGLGLTLTPAAASTDPGPTLVTRTTGTALAGAGTSQSILRSFNIVPTVNTSLNVTMDFAYFPHELNGIAVANLRLFKSVSGGTPWIPQPGTTAFGNVLTKTGISDFSIWTLGNAANPLPVELAAFTATPVNNTAVRLAWATASEKNSASFEVERSVDGTGFDRIATVAAAGSSSPRSYGFLDAQLPAGAAVLYYRLRQVDLDGTTSYSPVRSVTLKGAAGLVLYPNPAHGGAATLTGAVPGTMVTVFDALGRAVTAAPADATGTAALTLPAGLAAGVYVVRAGSKALRLTVE